MPNERLGEDLQIYPPLYDAVQRGLRRESTQQGQAEFNRIGDIIRHDVPGNAQATVDFTAGKMRQASPASDQTISENTGDLNTRRQRLLNNFNDSLYDSERKFLDGIKTRGLDSALKMFGSQLGAETNTRVAESNMAGQWNQQQQLFRFGAAQNELDRVLQQERFGAQMNIQQMQNRRQNAGAVGGIIGSAISLGSRFLPFL
jgi:hypothetical protein